MNKLHLAPSLLSADFSNLEKAVKQIEDNKQTDFDLEKEILM